MHMNRKRHTTNKLRLIPMKLSTILLCSSLIPHVASAGVVTYPAPKNEPVSDDYQVTAAGQSVAVYTARTADPLSSNPNWKRNYGGPYWSTKLKLTGFG